MSMSGRASVLLAALLALTLGAASANAQPPKPQGDSLGADWREQQNEAREKVRKRDIIPLERVVDTIRRKTPGRLLDAGIEQGGDGRSLYRVRWAAASGRRIDFLVDAVSGAIVSADGR